MSTPRFVQHVSGQGEIFAISPTLEHSDRRDVWHVFQAQAKYNLWLPKSEYRLVPPPERWVDVTGECAVYYQTNESLLCHSGTRVCEKNGYRLRKVLMSRAGLSPFPACECWAFLVERKEPA